jgi:hypothetical protein
MLTSFRISRRIRITAGSMRAGRRCAESGGFGGAW